MGIGDSLMASGEARKLNRLNGLPVVITDRRGRPQWSDIWDGIPYIIKREAGKPTNRILNCSGVRPYIVNKTASRWTWRPYKPTPAQIVFTSEEIAFAKRFKGMVMIEPNTKAIGHSNKAWLPERWAELAYLLRKRHNQNVVQCSPDAHGFLTHVTTAITPNFRQAAAVLSVAKLFIGTEGGLMHAAAAVGTRSVILWSEFISPEITGYATMTNLRHAGKPCGNRVNCPGCRKSMEAITVDEVLNAVKGFL